MINVDVGINSEAGKRFTESPLFPFCFHINLDAATGTGGGDGTLRGWVTGHEAAPGQEGQLEAV